MAKFTLTTFAGTSITWDDEDVSGDAELLRYCGNRIVGGYDIDGNWLDGDNAMREPAAAYEALVNALGPLGAKCDDPPPQFEWPQGIVY